MVRLAIVRFSHRLRWCKTSRIGTPRVQSRHLCNLVFSRPRILRIGQARYSSAQAVAQVGGHEPGPLLACREAVLDCLLTFSRRRSSAEKEPGRSIVIKASIWVKSAFSKLDVTALDYVDVHSRFCITSRIIPTSSKYPPRPSVPLSSVMDI